MDKQPKNSRTLDLYVRLCEGKTINKTEEAQRFGVDERSIQRDIDDIRAFLYDRSATTAGDNRNVNYDRAKKGARFGVLCSIIIAELIGVVIYTAAPVLIAAFNSEPDVVHYGVMQSRTIALFYFLLAFSHCIAAVLRGSGNASVPMIVMLCVWCLFRVSYITVTVHFIPDIRVIFWAYPLTWSISSVIFLALFLRGKWVYGFEKRK